MTRAGLGEVPILPTVSAEPPQRAVIQNTVVATQRSKRMSEVLLQGDESHFPVLNHEEVAKLRANYVAITGDQPLPQMRPSADQLGALKHRLAQGHAPYVDFAIFGPYGSRLQLERKFSAQTFVQGELVTKMVQGTRTVESWLESWHVFSSCMLMLGAANVAVLARYAEGIQYLARRHPNQWGVIMAADQKVRLEHWDILAEDAIIASPPGFDKAQPWVWVIRASTFGAKSELADWWRQQVTDPLTFSSNRAAAAAADTEGVGAPGPGARKPRAPPPPPAPKVPGDKKRPRGGKGGESKKLEICWAWNRDRQGCTSPCATGRKHACEFCDGNHRGIDCPKGKGTGKAPRGAAKAAKKPRRGSSA